MSLSEEQQFVRLIRSFYSEESDPFKERLDESRAEELVAYCKEEQKNWQDFVDKNEVIAEHFEYGMWESQPIYFRALREAKVQTQVYLDYWKKHDYFNGDFDPELHGSNEKNGYLENKKLTAAGIANIFRALNKVQEGTVKQNPKGIANALNRFGIPTDRSQKNILNYLKTAGDKDPHHAEALWQAVGWLLENNYLKAASTAKIWIDELKDED
jgi:hypothetical protein